MKHKLRYRRYRRARLARITPLGWFLVAFGCGLLLLLGWAGYSWLRDNLNTTPPPPPTAEVGATPAPSPPAPTTEVTPTVAHPAWWAAGMVQDAQGQWWPAAADLDAVVATVEEHYRDWYAHAVGPYDSLLETTTDADARRYATGEVLEGWFWLKQQYLELGRFPELVQVVTDRALTVQAFSQDGLSCQVGDTYRAAYHLHYDPLTATWDRVDLPASGVLDGVQYLGVSVKELRYDTEDGRWKVATSSKWIPRPATATAD